ncbi:16S rRNA (cytosine(1402)-N(4))-methyltransferase RsmH [Bradymonas sediminis]|uniref:16S rRNA (cytosine(1402)-N(4))-methyltransferase RsmH n=1 Tax=Bradymonas sediminis TaxID=1548548 RepID=UPI0010EC0F2E|nr:16S rRNA (cytosine(1402)-N(4))-methyltransferase RsmH [Bradymonas sediminis]TDP76736.1 16S rRNA (cytosine1402-N4)-methyltransferase [Bradymonas sediminis]
MPNTLKYATEYHTPIMVDEVIRYLQVRPGARFVDGTAGGGGHSAAILDAGAPSAQLLSIDRDPEAIAQVQARLAGAGDRFRVVQGNYGDVERICAENDFSPVDGFLVDAGVSSHQLDEAERGFSFRRAGPLDMRMGPDAPSLAEYLADVEPRELMRVLSVYGEIRSAKRVALAILEAFEAGKLHSTVDLTAVVEDTIGGGARGGGQKTKIHPATLVFQGLRIAINRELDTLEAAVRAIPKVVKPGGRAAFISFHSLEDRIVKHGFRELANDCVCPPDFPICACDERAKVKVLTSRALTAGPAELEQNPRARSAKLRVVEVL